MVTMITQSYLQLTMIATPVHMSLLYCNWLQHKTYNYILILLSKQNFKIVMSIEIHYNYSMFSIYGKHVSKIAIFFIQLEFSVGSLARANSL